MGNYIQKLFACAVLLLPSCFQAQSTFGYPCVVNEDCDSTQLCVEGVCESGFGVADSTGGTTGDATGDSMGEGTSASDDSSSNSTGEPSDDGATDTGGETMEAMVRLVQAKRRPIGFLTSLVRVHGRLRTDTLRAWQREHACSCSQRTWSRHRLAQE